LAHPELPSIGTLRRFVEDLPRSSPAPLRPAACKLVQIDPFFIPPGAEAYPRDNLSATNKFSGHRALSFALETHIEETTAAMRRFLVKTTVHA
jgi:hypothetical protein